jgi:hypothetical protein
LRIGTVSVDLAAMILLVILWVLMLIAQKLYR